MQRGERQLSSEIRMGLLVTRVLQGLRNIQDFLENECKICAANPLGGWITGCITIICWVIVFCFKSYRLCLCKNWFSMHTRTRMEWYQRRRVRSWQRKVWLRVWVFLCERTRAIWLWQGLRNSSLISSNEQSKKQKIASDIWGKYWLSRSLKKGVQDNKSRTLGGQKQNARLEVLGNKELRWHQWRMFG